MRSDGGGDDFFLAAPRTAEDIRFSVDDTEEILERYCRDYFGGDYYALAKCYYDTEASVIDRTHPDLIGHFDLVARFNDSMHFIDEEDERYLKCALETLEYLSKAGVPFEINCGAVNRGRKKESGSSLS